MSIKEDIKKAMEMIREAKYEPTMYPVICGQCGRVYGETPMGPIIANCGKHGMGD
jgi:hypothetical protein